MIVCPIRHHSPAGAYQVASLIRSTRPRLILVEGPSDATDLIPRLVSDDTRLPVALLAYSSADLGEKLLVEGEKPRSLFWPFCDYSPEYVALRIGRELGAELRFIDLPAGMLLENNWSDPGQVLVGETPSVWQTAAESFGFADFEEFWECRFEMMSSVDARKALLALGGLVRAAGMDDHHLTREAWMRSEIEQAQADGYESNDILVVCGAAHAPELERPSTTARLPVGQPRTTNLTLIPYSYPRLSEQLGYGAGNRAPAFYQRVWAQGVDFVQASQEMLIHAARDLRHAGYAVTVADAIEANRLANTLADLRDKPAPGLNEVLDAIETCYSQGRQPASRIIWPLLVGEAIGAVSAQTTPTSLQQEFHDNVARFGLPFSDSAQEIRLYLTQPADVEKSVFLHRLVAAEIPFAQVQALQMVGRRPNDASDSSHWLGQLREKWILQWTPVTEMSLAERSVQGNSLEDVCIYQCRRRLEAVRHLNEASDLLLRIVLVRLKSLYDEGLAACERASSSDDDLTALARSAYTLQSLIKYGSSRAVAEHAIEALLGKIYVRSNLLLPAAAAVADERAPDLRQALISLHDVARQSPTLDTALLTIRLRMTAESDCSHPAIAGVACTLLFLGGDLQESELSVLLSRRFSAGDEPLAGAQFLEGLLALNRGVLLRNPLVVGWLNSFLQAAAPDRFTAVLPVLRRAFSDLTPSETDYLLRTLAFLLDLEPEQARVPGKAVDPVELAAIDDVLGSLLDRL